jgi:hypothetical protein
LNLMIRVPREKVQRLKAEHLVWQLIYPKAEANPVLSAEPLPEPELFFAGATDDVTTHRHKAAERE